jgi:hypothetical protein
MFRFRVKPPANDLLSFDWQSVLDQLNKCDPKSGDFYLIVTNKGKDDEYRTKFLTYQEALELVMLALEKKKLRIPLPL